MIKLEIIHKGRRRYSNVYHLLKLDRSDRPNSNKTGQSDLHIGHTDRSDRSEGTTNKNKEKEFIKKNCGSNEKTGDNFTNMKARLAEKMSMNKERRWTAMEDT